MRTPNTPKGHPTVRHRRPAAKPTLVYVVGFMGAGKTSVGARLAELLGWRFVDLDQEIERRCDEPIRSMFRTRGEAWFRSQERAELERVSSLTRAIVALGGGAFCFEENRRIVEATGVSVWLDASIETIHARCAGDATRPLFTSLEEMGLLLQKRRPYYEKSQLRLEVGDQSVVALARQVIRLLGLRSKRSRTRVKHR